MKLEPLTKNDMKNKTTSRKFDGDAMSENCDVTAIFPIYGQFRAISKPNSLQKLKTELKICNTALTLLL